MPKPKFTHQYILDLIKAKGFADGIPLKGPYIIGIRGYYLNGMGVVGKNDRNIYDDAFAFMYGDQCVPFNGNCDPSGVREAGTNGPNDKGMAVLIEGWHNMWVFGDHHQGTPRAYPALVQRRPCTVKRDGGILDTGLFGINFHAGGENTTGSEGCQTTPKSQYLSAYNTIKAFAQDAYGDEYEKQVIPYLLINNQ